MPVYYSANIRVSKICHYFFETFRVYFIMYKLIFSTQKMHFYCIYFIHLYVEQTMLYIYVLKMFYIYVWLTAKILELIFIRFFCIHKLIFSTRKIHFYGINFIRLYVEQTMFYIYVLQMFYSYD